MPNMRELALPSGFARHEAPMVFALCGPLITPNYSFLDRQPRSTPSRSFFSSSSLDSNLRVLGSVIEILCFWIEKQKKMKPQRNTQSLVKIRLDDPIRELPDLTKLLAWCAFANIISEVDDIHQDGCKEQVFADIARMCRLIAPGRSVQDVLQERGMLAHFASLNKLLQRNSASADHTKSEEVQDGCNGQNSGEDYITYISVLNQLLVVSGQLYEDVTQPHNHKYIAHQIALLYQCLNQVRGETKHFKRRIEEKFDEIKRTTESSNASHLDDFYKRWLRGLTEDVQAFVASFTPQVYTKIKPMADSIQKSTSF